jgi:hypothetical protein
VRAGGQVQWEKIVLGDIAYPYWRGRHRDWLRLVTLDRSRQSADELKDLRASNRCQLVSFMCVRLQMHKHVVETRGFSMRRICLFGLPTFCAFRASALHAKQTANAAAAYHTVLVCHHQLPCQTPLFPQHNIFELEVSAIPSRHSGQRTKCPSEENPDFGEARGCLYLFVPSPTAQPMAISPRPSRTTSP